MGGQSAHGTSPYPRTLNTRLLYSKTDAKFSHLMKTMPKSILGIDYGDKKIGLAIADSKTQVALIYGIVRNDSQLWQTLAHIIAKEHIATAVIGIPYNLKGKHTEQTMVVQQFCAKFQKKFPSITVILEDERYTTKIASQSAQSKFDDSAAAVFILQGYLAKMTHA